MTARFLEGAEAADSMSAASARLRGCFMSGNAIG